MSPAQASSVTPLPQQGGAPIEPDFGTFARLYDAGTPQVAWTRLVADLDPFDASIHSRLGKRLLAKGESAAAILEFQAALALGPTNPADAHTDLGEALLKSGRTAEARAAAMAALAQAPTYARAQDLLLATQSAGR